MNKIIQELLYYSKRLAQENFVVASGGNISVRDKNILYITRAGSFMEKVTRNDFIKIDLNTDNLEKFAGKVSHEMWMHIYCYRKTPDIKAVIHSHPVYTTCIATAGLKFKPITCEFISIIGSEVSTVKYFPPGSKELAKEVSSKVRKFNAVIMANHGSITVGDNLSTAFYRTKALEQEAMRFVIGYRLKNFRFLTKRKVNDILAKGE